MDHIHSDVNIFLNGFPNSYCCRVLVRFLPDIRVSYTQENIVLVLYPLLNSFLISDISYSRFSVYLFIITSNCFKCYNNLDHSDSPDTYEVYSTSVTIEHLSNFSIHDDGNCSYPLYIFFYHGTLQQRFSSTIFSVDIFYVIHKNLHSSYSYFRRYLILRFYRVINVDVLIDYLYKVYPRMVYSGIWITYFGHAVNLVFNCGTDR